MDTKKIKENNEPQFLKDLKTVSEVLVYTEKTDEYFKITKGELIRKAERSEVRYYLTDKIFVVKRMSMVVI
jgi:hypothetical protein